MSKIVDKLKQVSEAAVPPIGFKSAAVPKQAPLVLIGELTLPQEIKEVGQSLDAFLIRVSNLSKEIDDLKKLKAISPENIPYGVALKSVTEKSVAQLKEAACDFIAFKPIEASAASISEESLGRIVIANSSWTDTNLRSLEHLLIDAILVEDMDDKTSLTVQSLIELRRITLLTSKPVLIKLSYFPPEKELSALLNIKVQGLVVSAKSEKDLSEMPKLRSLIENLPRTKPKKPSPAPFVPTLVDTDLAEEEE